MSRASKGIFKLCNYKFSYFTSTSKDTEALYRIDKLNIFEYFKFYKQRTYARPLDCLLKELTLYFQSNYFDAEFKRILNTDIKKFRFFNLHLTLLSTRLKDISKTADIRTALQLKLACYKLDNCFIKFYSEEALCFYIQKEYKITEEDFLLENELINLLSKDQVSFFKIKKSFMSFLAKPVTNNTLDNKSKDEFIDLVLKKYLLTNEDKIIEFTSEKLRTYFIANLNYLNTLSHEEIFKNKIYWGLNEIKLINH